MQLDKICILLCTCNGERYVVQQLQSIAAQRGSFAIEVFVSDDNSTDKTVELIRQFSQRESGISIKVQNGPSKGFSANFQSAVANCASDAAYYAFCDQDDIWEPEKLMRALENLEGYVADRPCLYCGRTALISESGSFLGQSPNFKRAKTFRNALVQSIAGGNTMVFNYSAYLLLYTTCKEKIVSHDWWLYLLVSGVGGAVIYDQKPYVQYRQHANNAIGSNMGFKARINRIQRLMRGDFKNWIDVNLAALKHHECHLTAENKEIFNTFLHARRSGFVRRMVQSLKLRLYRQTVLGTLSLYIGIAMRRI